MIRALRVLGSLWPIYTTARCGCVIRIHLGSHSFDASDCEVHRD